MKARVVIGAGFGDEGKGVFTNYFSSLSDKSLVVRFNGGAQAGHTVISPTGIRHVFGHFTANSFLPDAKGYLSKHFIINPIIFLKELEELNQKGIKPVIAAHDDCYLTTPYDMLINRWLERSRGDNSRHGSCGLGIGESIHRSEIALKPLQLKDTSSIITLREKLIIISAFFEKRVIELGLQEYYENNGIILHEILADRFIEDVIEMRKHLLTGVNDFQHDYFEGYDVIFEGAQGLMLDQNMGDFPHVTRSNTGLKNVIEICVENNITELDVLYATRCYKTRHGAGNLNHELPCKPYPGIVDETNIPNEHQGAIRFAYLDIDELIYYIDKDADSVQDIVIRHGIKLNKSIGITCLDQTDTVFYYECGELKNCKSEYFKDEIEVKGFKVLTRSSP